MYDNSELWDNMSEGANYPFSSNYMEPSTISMGAGSSKTKTYFEEHGTSKCETIGNTVKEEFHSESKSKTKSRSSSFGISL